MGLKIRKLVMRATTSNENFGADLIFHGGLNVLHAENSMGKTTCLHAILYALGLEKIFTTRKTPPLTHAMTKMLKEKEDGDDELAVEESFVSVEIENGQGEILTTQRQVVPQTASDLILTWDGPRLTAPDGQYTQSDFAGPHYPGSAQRGFGFQHRFAQFLEWRLPEVSRFDGGVSPLYLELLFPLAFVEQKAGWSAIPARVPTVFGIRNPGKRGVEFTLGLDVFQITRERQELLQSLHELEKQWSNLYGRAVEVAESVQGRIDNIDTLSDSEFTEEAPPSIIVPQDDTWLPLITKRDALQSRLAQLSAIDMPDAEGRSQTAQRELKNSMEVLSDKKIAFYELQQNLALEKTRTQTLKNQLTTLDEDLTRNKDAKKLVDLGSELTGQLTPDQCPTCYQKWPTTLTTSETNGQVMSLEANIEYIKNQSKMFQGLFRQSQEITRRMERKLSVLAEEITEIQSRIRALKETLTSRQRVPSVADIQERLALEEKIRDFDDAMERFDGLVQQLQPLPNQYSLLKTRQRKLPKDGMSKKDNAKVHHFARLVREQLRAYNFQTFPPGKIDISPQTYRPEMDGFELNYESSASDLIRLKWAYQLGLMEVAREHASCNHPGFLIFDEPRQQEVEQSSLGELFVRAAASGTSGQQVIVVTSEEKTTLDRLLQGLDCHYLSFDGYLIKRIPNENEANVAE